VLPWVSVVEGALMNNPLTLRGIVAGLLKAGGQAWRAVRQMRSRLALSIIQRRQRRWRYPFPPHAA
jgi:hypothetical protein